MGKAKVAKPETNWGKFYEGFINKKTREKNEALDDLSNWSSGKDDMGPGTQDIKKRKK